MNKAFVLAGSFFLGGLMGMVIVMTVQSFVEGKLVYPLPLQRLLAAVFLAGFVVSFFGWSKAL